MFGGHGLIHDDSMTVGIFLAQLKIVRTLGSAYNGIYKICTELEEIYPSLVRITRFLNLETDIKQHLELDNYRREKEAERRAKCSIQEDDVPIKIENVNLTYSPETRRVNHGMFGRERGCEVVRMDHVALPGKGKMEFNQGQFVVLTGPQHGGKATLLNIVAG